MATEFVQFTIRIERDTVTKKIVATNTTSSSKPHATSVVYPFSYLYVLRVADEIYTKCSLSDEKLKAAVDSIQVTSDEFVEESPWLDDVDEE